MEKKRLVLIDAHAIIHRAYHALPPMHTKNGEPTNAVYGFVNMLMRAISDLQPTWIAVAFDLPTPTFRHKEYIAYQAHRPQVEEDLKSQIVKVRELVKAAGLPIYEKKGFEADDVLGSLAKRAAKKKSVDEVIIVTGDRDTLQLVDKKIKIYAPVKGLTEASLFDRAKTKEYLHITPEQVVDYKALVGDSSDNYPGVVGIGPKTAVALLQVFGSLDKIYKALKRGMLQGFAPSVSQKLQAGKDSAMLSKKLAKIVTTLPIKLDFKKAKLPQFSQNEEFLKKLRLLGFRSILKRIIGDDDKRKEHTQIRLV